MEGNSGCIRLSCLPPQRLSRFCFQSDVPPLLTGRQKGQVARVLRTPGQAQEVPPIRLNQGGPTPLGSSRRAAERSGGDLPLAVAVCRASLPSRARRAVAEPEDPQQRAARWPVTVRRSRRARPAQGAGPTRAAPLPGADRTQMVRRAQEEKRTAAARPAQEGDRVVQERRVAAARRSRAARRPSVARPIPAADQVLEAGQAREEPSLRAAPTGDVSSRPADPTSGLAGPCRTQQVVLPVCPIMPATSIRTTER